MSIEELMAQWIAPRVQADGGWLEIMEKDGSDLTLKAKGECARCISLERCLKWIASQAEEKTSEKVNVTAVREPFIWKK